MEFRSVKEEVGGNVPEIHCSRHRSRAAWQIIQDVSRESIYDFGIMIWLNIFLPFLS